MTLFVIDASVAIKWVVTEEGSEEALALAAAHRLAAPDMLTIECANILWKKVRRSEISSHTAQLAGRLLQGSEIDLVPMRDLIGRSLQLAVELEHAAYDCVYLALAAAMEAPFVTADESLLRKIGPGRARRLGFQALSLSAAVRSRPHN